MRRGDVAVAVLDLELPDTSGLDLLRHAAGLPARPDVVLLTGHPALDSALAAIDTEAAGYLTGQVLHPSGGWVMP